MFSKLLLVLGIAFGYGSNLTLKANNNFTHTPNNSYRFSFIDYESPAFRLGDYHILNIGNVTAAGGQIRFAHIKAVIPGSVFDILAEYQNVFITIPNYGYNPSVDLVMRIERSSDYTSVLPADYPYDELPLSESMLKVLPYTMLDIPYEHNVYDRDTWTNNGTSFSIGFTIPYTEYTNHPSQWQDALRNITLFTKRSVGEPSYYDSGYSDGYGDGYDDGYRDGDEWGYQDGYYDGKDDGYDIGFADAEAIADGSWLGSLVFGTIGGIVGFLFALSDFEVLGVSIMSIITLFVAIGIVRLLLKVLK